MVLLLLLLLLRLLLLRSIAVRTLAERSAVLESAVQGRVTRQEIGPLMQSAIEPFQKRVEITLQQHASVIASTSAQAHNATATAEASRVETQVGTRLLAGGRVSVMVTYACTQARMNERLATLTTAPTTTPSMVVEEVNRAVREAELALEGRLENRWDLQLSKLRERMTVLWCIVFISRKVYLSVVLSRSVRVWQQKSAVRTDVGWRTSSRQHTTPCFRYASPCCACGLSSAHA